MPHIPDPEEHARRIGGGPRRVRKKIQYGPGRYRLVWTPLSDQYELGLQAKGHDLFAFIRSNPIGGGWDYGVINDTEENAARGHANTKEEAEAAVNVLLQTHVQAILIDPREKRSTDYETVAPADIDGMLLRGEIDIATALAYREAKVAEDERFARERMMLEDMQWRRGRRREVQVRGHPRKVR